MVGASAAVGSEFIIAFTGHPCGGAHFME